jgi:hypothetical protein
LSFLEICHPFLIILSKIVICNFLCFFRENKDGEGIIHVGRSGSSERINPKPRHLSFLVPNGSFKQKIMTEEICLLKVASADQAIEQYKQKQAKEDKEHESRNTVNPGNPGNKRKSKIYSSTCGEENWRNIMTLIGESEVREKTKEKISEVKKLEEINELNTILDGVTERRIDKEELGSLIKGKKTMEESYNNPLHNLKVLKYSKPRFLKSKFKPATIERSKCINRATFCSPKTNSKKKNKQQYLP